VVNEIPGLCFCFPACCVAWFCLDVRCSVLAINEMLFGLLICLILYAVGFWVAGPGFVCLFVLL
jgi:hypothetical protein